MSQENTTKPPKSAHTAITPLAAREILWRQGILHWMLHSGQKSLYDSYLNCKEKTIVWNASRRCGKSFALCIIAIETCLQTENAVVKYSCAKQKDAKDIIRPIIRQIIESAPEDLRPKFKQMERAWIFPNGSRIELSGLDGGHAESLRGGSAQLAIVDEAGLVTDLKYVIRSIILPTTTTTKGKIILASTPPKSSGHPFVEFMSRARIQGNLVTKTIYDNPNIDKYELEKIIEECGGINSTEFRREYLAEVIIDTNWAVVPEFTKEIQEQTIKETIKPPFYDCYVSMDLGFKDLTVVLFAYYDFRNAKVVIEDEFVINGQKFNTNSLAQGIKDKEKLNFTDIVTNEQRIPSLRVSDNNLIVINDLYVLHGIRFIPTRKDDRDSALNNLKILIQEGRLVINPRCTTVIRHLQEATWNKSKTDFERSSDNGHYDAIPALYYLCRNINMQKNPYPLHYGAGSQEHIYRTNSNSVPTTTTAWGKVFKLNR